MKLILLILGLVSLFTFASSALVEVVERSCVEMDVKTLTDNFLYVDRLDKFLAHIKDENRSKDLVWDYGIGCQGTIGTPFSVLFRTACIRHRFGIQNYKQQGRLTKAAKERILQNYKLDFNTICEDAKNRDRCTFRAHKYFVQHYPGD